MPYRAWHTFQMAWIWRKGMREKMDSVCPHPRVAEPQGVVQGQRRKAVGRGVR